MLEQINEKEFYHICLYEDYMLEEGIEYNSSKINRTFSNCSELKQQRELEFENYRSNKCPDLPSREKSFYVCQKKDVEIWLKKLHIGKSKRLRYKIFKISCTGKIFWANANFFDDDEDSISSQKYWEGCESTDFNSTVEGLFIGEYKAIKDCTKDHKLPL